MGGRAVVVFVGAIVHVLDTLTVPTTSTDNTEKINRSSSTSLTSGTTIVGVTNAAQQRFVAAGHAFVQDLRRGHFEIALEHPIQDLVLVRTAFTELAD